MLFSKKMKMNRNLPEAPHLPEAAHLPEAVHLPKAVHPPEEDLLAVAPEAHLLAVLAVHLRKAVLLAVVLAAHLREAVLLAVVLAVHLSVVALLVAALPVVVLVAHLREVVLLEAAPVALQKAILQQALQRAVAPLVLLEAAVLLDQNVVADLLVLSVDHQSENSSSSSLFSYSFDIIDFDQINVDPLLSNL